MLLRKLGRVKAILARKAGVCQLLVEVDQAVRKAINYDELTGRVKVGDRVVLNTTAIALDLGTGGYHFVIHVLDQEGQAENGRGHIMKLRYTPLQFACEVVEEEGSPYRETMVRAGDIDGVPVVCGSLHSILPAAAAGGKVRTGWKARVIYVMSDGGALPLAFSKLVPTLQEKGLIDGTITTGHAFGGDLEAVNLYSGLVAAKHALGADIIVVCMGPGIVGTGTTFGNTGIELGQIVNAVASLGGIPIAVPRISFRDSRERHWGISHHTLTALGQVALRPAFVVLPSLPRKEFFQLRAQLVESGVWSQHRLMVADGKKPLGVLKESGIRVSTMGRSMEEEGAFFEAAGAAGTIAGEFSSPRARGVRPM